MREPLSAKIHRELSKPRNRGKPVPLLEPPRFERRFAALRHPAVVAALLYIVLILLCCLFLWLLISGLHDEQVFGATEPLPFAPSAPDAALRAAPAFASQTRFSRTINHAFKKGTHETQSITVVQGPQNSAQPVAAA